MSVGWSGLGFGISLSWAKILINWVTMVISRLCFELEQILGHLLYYQVPPCWLGKVALDLLRYLPRYNHSDSIDEYLGSVLTNPKSETTLPNRHGGPQEQKWPRICSNLKHKKVFMITAWVKFDFPSYQDPEYQEGPIYTLFSGTALPSLVYLYSLNPIQ